MCQFSWPQIWVSGLRVWDLGFRVYGWGFLVQGSGCLEFVAEFGVCNGLLEQEGLTVDGENLAPHKISS